MNGGRFTWIDFYVELADKLIGFKGGRPALIKAIEEAYAAAGMSLPKLDSGGVPTDIDPFTVYGLFNKGLTDANRRKIVGALAEVFCISSDAPTDFDGVPLMNNLNATFYAFTDDSRRHDGDIDRLWDVFEAALMVADNDNPSNRARFVASYDAAFGQFGLNWKLTAGLFWLRPHYFISLDSRNRWYLCDIAAAGDAVADIVPREKSPTAPRGEEYLGICDAVRAQLGTDECSCTSFPELSYVAFEESERVNEEKKANSAKKVEKAEKANALGDAEVETQRCWIYSPGTGAHLWDVLLECGEMAIGWEEIGDLSTYPTKDAMKEAMKEFINPELSFKNAAHATWQFAKEMRPGDIVYAKRGMREVIGRGVVTSDYRFEEGRGEDLCNVRSVEWTHSGSWVYPGQAPMKTLTDITPYTQTCAHLKAVFEEEDGVGDAVEVEVTYPAYSRSDFLDEVFVGERGYDILVGLLKGKKNVILQGAPGVGKTFAAKRLAYSIMGEKDVDRVMMVQFHQSYSYEDFIEGFRPTESGFVLSKGAFYEFCKKAEEDEDRDYFFIIDEINRGNLSKIFGELFMLIEGDKRGPRNKLQLLYSRELFYVPSNVHLIGMMNTADRSLAMLDYALRRRFAFFDLRPGFGSAGFAEYRDGLGSARFNSLIACVERLNAAIASDDSLGEGFCIGHSYFCGMDPEEVTDDRLSAIVEYELVPMLREYWFDEPLKVREWADALRRSVK